ncbi:hypothetical protein EDD64_10779 [Effusibacillus lacus]|nr:hypothetical protein EDD64_10779 [Effusibacillus lacus]
MIIAIGIRITMKTLSIPLNTLSRIVVAPILSKQPVKVPKRVRTTTMLLIRLSASLRTRRCVVSDVLLDVAIPNFVFATVIISITED